MVRCTVRRTERISYVCNRTVLRTADHPLDHDHSAGCSRTVPWYTSAGRRIYAIGTSRESAAVAGIKEPKVTFYSFVICGAVTGLAGMLYTANYAIGYYGMADGFEMTAIAICVLGGVSITGGERTYGGCGNRSLIMSGDHIFH